MAFHSWGWDRKKMFKEQWQKEYIFKITVKTVEVDVKE